MGMPEGVEVGHRLLGGTHHWRRPFWTGSVDMYFGGEYDRPTVHVSVCARADIERAILKAFMRAAEAIESGEVKLEDSHG